jgi:hypothetical protein
MKAKKKTKIKLSDAGNKVRAVTTFKGNSGSDLDLTVGDEITIIQKVSQKYVYVMKKQLHVSKQRV